MENKTKNLKIDPYTNDLQCIKNKSQNLSLEIICMYSYIKHNFTILKTGKYNTNYTTERIKSLQLIC